MDKSNTDKISGKDFSGKNNGVTMSQSSTSHSSDFSENVVLDSPTSRQSTNSSIECSTIIKLNNGQASSSRRRKASSSREQEASSSREQEASSSKEQEASSSREQEVTSSREQEASSSREQEASSSREQEVTSSKEQEASSSREQEVTSSKEQEASSSREQEVTSSKEQEASSSREQEASSSRKQEASSSREQEAFSRFQGAGNSGTSAMNMFSQSNERNADSRGNLTEKRSSTNSSDGFATYNLPKRPRWETGSTEEQQILPSVPLYPSRAGNAEDIPTVDHRGEATVDPEDLATVDPEFVAAVDPEDVATVDPREVATVDPEFVAAVDPREVATDNPDEVIFILRPPNTIINSFALPALNDSDAAEPLSPGITFRQLYPDSQTDSDTNSTDLETHIGYYVTETDYSSDSLSSERSYPVNAESYSVNSGSNPLNSVNADSSPLNLGSNLSDLVEKSTDQKASSGNVEVIEDGGDGKLCSICFEAYTNSGEHRLCCLKCGHLFGHKCIKRWFKTQSKSSCPQCKQKNRLTDIRILYTNSLMAVDNSKIEDLKKLLMKEEQKKQERDLDYVHLKMEYDLLMRENRKLKEANASLLSPELSDKPSTETNELSVKFLKSITLSTRGSCRVVDFDKFTSTFAVSQRSPHTNFLFGFGVKQVNAELSSSRFVFLHNKVIKDIKFSPFQPNHLLSAAQDCCIKITDLESTATVVEYRTSKPVWSCCWHSKNRNSFFTGLSDGTYLQFDLRKLDVPVSSFSNITSKCPIISLDHVTWEHNFHEYEGLLSGTLENVCFLARPRNAELLQDYNSSIISAGAGSCADVQFEATTRHCLITYRPSRSSNKRSLHKLCAMNPDNFESLTCDVVDTFEGSKQHRSLSKNCIFQSSKGSLIVSTVDEALSFLKVFDVTRSCKNFLETDFHPLHCKSFTLDDCKKNQHIALVSEKSLSLYEIM